MNHMRLCSICTKYISFTETMVIFALPVYDDDFYCEKGVQFTNGTVQGARRSGGPTTHYQAEMHIDCYKELEEKC